MNTYNGELPAPSMDPIHLRFKGAYLIKQRMALMKQLAEKQHDELFNKSPEGKHKLKQVELMDIPESWHRVDGKLINSDKMAAVDWVKSGECAVFGNEEQCMSALKVCSTKSDSSMVDCLKALLKANSRELPSKVEAMVKELGPVMSVTILRGLDFKPMMKGGIKVVQSVDDWYAAKTNTNELDEDTRNGFEGDSDVQLFLRYLVAFVNSNPEIINKGHISKSTNVYEKYIPDDVFNMGVVEQIAPLEGFSDDGTRPMFAPRLLGPVTMKGYSMPEVKLPFMAPMAVVSGDGRMYRDLDEPSERLFMGAMYGGFHEELDFIQTI